MTPKLIQLLIITNKTPSTGYIKKRKNNSLMQARKKWKEGSTWTNQIIKQYNGFVKR